MARESALVAAIRRELDKRGAYTVKTHGSGVGRAGVPDLLCIHRGAGLAIEAKTARGRLSKLQAWELERVRAAGGRAIVARSVEDVRDVLDDIEDERSNI